MEIKDEPYYRVLGYQRAAESVAALGRPVTQVEDLTEMPHVGERTAEVIRDLAEDRTPQLLAELSAEIPAGLVERSEEHTSELQSRQYLVCRLLLEKKTYHR